MMSVEDRAQTKEEGAPMPVRTCVITGASRGIGRATALRFARAGSNIVAVARTKAELDEAARRIVAAGGACEPVTADIGQAEEARRTIAVARQRFGRVDVLVNNAGAAPLAAIDQLDPAEFDRVCAVNMAALFHTTRAVWPLMKAQGGGVIINMSSLASVDPFPGFGVYGASKAWVNLFSQAAASEGRPYGIRVFSVAPSAVETSLMRAAFPDFPAAKTLDPDDVAAVIVSLCDQALAHCSGQTIFVRR
jgi:NAD(P)-dependent dehydrogenase (short-subunit alcohol dehydrogenase family)